MPAQERKGPPGCKYCCLKGRRSSLFSSVEFFSHSKSLDF
jgi:hypothetical protein